ncbi:MAG: aminopeptidase P family protein, partial [Actinomycetota bacterium]
VTNLVNVRYLTGFSGSNGQVLIMPGEVGFFTDGRYEARAKDLVHEATIDIYLTRLSDVLAPRLASASVLTLGIEGATVTLAERDDLAARLGLVDLKATKGLVEHLRRRKEPAEVDLIREAIALGDRAYEWLLDRIEPGATERRIALDLEVWMRTSGADELSFEPIVGSGPLSAHIHHTPSERSLEKGDLVLADFGCKIDGYCSDLTRTVVLGPATDEQQRIYDLVLGANRAAFEVMSAGSSGLEVDAAARRVITEAGHGDEFGHGLGHGLGLDVHEAPRCARVSEDTLVAGDVVTNEPGVYVRGSGGVRIEDCVLITADGAEALTSAPKNELIEL